MEHGIARGLREHCISVLSPHLTLRLEGIIETSTISYSPVLFQITISVHVFLCLDVWESECECVCMCVYPPHNLSPSPHSHSLYPDPTIALTIYLMHQVMHRADQPLRVYPRFVSKSLFEPRSKSYASRQLLNMYAQSIRTQVVREQSHRIQCIQCTHFHHMNQLPFG